MYEQEEIYDHPVENAPSIHDSNTVQNISQIKDKLIEAFVTLCQSSPNQASLAKCHKTIANYQKRPEILQIFFELITQFHSQNQTLTKLVITQIFTYMKKQSSFGYDQRHDRLKITKLFLEFFVLSQVDYKFKKMAQNTFMQFIYASSNVKIREFVVKWVEQQIIRIISSTENSFVQLKNYNNLSSPIDIFIPSADIANQQNLKIASSLIHVLRCLFLGGNLEMEMMKSILPNCISIYYLMTLHITQNILIAVASKQEAVFAQKIEECSRFTEVFILMFSKTDSGKFPTLRERVLHTKQIYNLLLVLMALSPHFNSFKAVQNILTQTTISIGKQLNSQNITIQVKELISSLNFKQNFISNSILVQNLESSNTKILTNLVTIKKNSIQILIKCIKSLQRKKTQTIGQYNYLVAIVTNLWLQIKDCLIIATQNYLKTVQSKNQNNLQTLPIRKELQELLSICVKFLSEVTNFSPLYNVVSPYQNEIIFQLCFPWLISRQQHDRFQAEDYLFFRQDIINKQNMSYIQNSIGSLLQSYLDNIDGTITSIMVNCTNLISYHITKNHQFRQNMVQELQNSWAFLFYVPQRQIESALTLIAVESYLSLRRNDIAILLEKWLESHNMFFLNLKNDYRITTQFLMMYSYYVDNFYSNMIQGISSQDFLYRPLHKQILKFCCFLMKQNYDYVKNTYRGKVGQILYFEALDCLNNSLNHTDIVPVLYCNFPFKQQIMIPHYLIPYENYPFYPVKSLKQSPRKDQLEKSLEGNVFDSKGKEEEFEVELKQILVHYRKLGLNRIEYIQKRDLIEIVQFLGENLSSRGNIKIMQILIEFMIGYIKQQLNHQGSLINIPIIFREEIPRQLAVGVYSLMHSKSETFFPNRNLFEAKATELIYVLHTIAIDPYEIYSLGLETVWLNHDFWNFNPTEDDNNINALLKCTDLVVRLALKNYSSQKGVNISYLIQSITENLIQNSYQYLVRIHKFNILFGILLNIILLKINSQKVLEFLYLLITEKLMKAELSDDVLQSQLQTQKYTIPSSQASELLSQAFYLFLLNIYTNPTILNTEKNFKLLTVFYQYLTHFVNAHKIVTQLGDVFGKIFASAICILQKQYINDSIKIFDHNTTEFLWKNILYSGKIYKTQLQTRIVAIKLLNLIRQIIKRNDPEFSLERVELMYQVACSCVFYSKNKDLLMSHEDDDSDQDFDHAGEQQQWENTPITMSKNDTDFYIEDEVLLLKKTSRELLQSQNIQIKQWIAKLIQTLPVAVKNFVKNKVINYEQDAKQVGLRKIIKVKRPENENLTGVTKKQIINENIGMRKQKEANQQESQDL